MHGSSGLFQCFIQVYPRENTFFQGSESKICSPRDTNNNTQMPATSLTPAWTGTMSHCVPTVGLWRQKCNLITADIALTQLERVRGWSSQETLGKFVGMHPTPHTWCLRSRGLGRTLLWVLVWTYQAPCPACLCGAHVRRVKFSRCST